MSSFHHFEKQPPGVVNGKIALPERPGFGIELDPGKIEKQTLLRWA
jgi:L-alanine-DL-glutamate epimerase-like enolase superfamily enzyme